MPESKSYVANSDEKGSINISEDVVAIIAAMAATEVEGVRGPFISHNKDLTSAAVKKGLSRGVKLHFEGNEATIDVNIIVEIGFSVSEIGAQVQKAVITAVEDAVGATVKAVNVNICGIALKKR